MYLIITPQFVSRNLPPPQSRLLLNDRDLSHTNGHIEKHIPQKKTNEILLV